MASTAQHAARSVTRPPAPAKLVSPKRPRAVEAAPLPALTRDVAMRERERALHAPDLLAGVAGVAGMLAARAAPEADGEAGPPVVAARARFTSNDPASVVEWARRAPRAELPHRAAARVVFGDAIEAVEVRVGEPAREACEALGAAAFAAGNVVVFAEPTPPLARVLHEIAHVVQQGAQRSPAPARFAPGSLTLSAPGSRAEREAGAFVRGWPELRALEPHPLKIYRDAETDENSLDSVVNKRLLRLMKKFRMKDFGSVGKDITGAAPAPFGVRGPDKKLSRLFRYSYQDSIQVKEMLPVLRETEPELDEANVSDTLYKYKNSARGRYLREGFQVKAADDSLQPTVLGYVGDPERKVFYYTFVGPDYDGKAPYEHAGFDGWVEPTTVETRERLTPEKALEKYLDFINDLITIAAGTGSGKKHKPAKVVPLAKVPEVKTFVEGKLADTSLDKAQRAAAATQARHDLVDAIVADYDDMDELHAHVFEAGVFAGPFAGIQGNIWVTWVAKKHPSLEGRFDPKIQPIFGKNLEKMGVESEAWEKIRKGDGVITVKDKGNVVFEGKAYTSGPGEEQIKQIHDYAKVVDPERRRDPKRRILGYFLRDNEPVAEPFIAVLYTFSGDKAGLEIAKLWLPELEKGFGKANKEKTWDLLPDPADPQKITSLLVVNPTFQIEIPNADEVEQHFPPFSKPPQHNGITLTSLDLTLAYPRKPAIVSGKLAMDLDLKGVVSTEPGKPIEKPIEPVAEAQAEDQIKPAKPPSKAKVKAHGRIENKLEGFKSKLDKLLKRLKPSARLLDDGVRATLSVTKGESGIPGFDIDGDMEGNSEANVSVTLGKSAGRSGFVVAGSVALSHRSGKLRGGVKVEWKSGALAITGSVTVKDFIDGLEPFQASVAYTAADEKAGTPENVVIFAKQAKIRKKFNAVTITGAATNLKYDVNKQLFSGDGAITALLGPLGQASADIKIVDNQLDQATLTYNTPAIGYPKGKEPAFTLQASGTVHYDRGKFSGTIEASAKLTSAKLKKLNKNLAAVELNAQVSLAEDGSLSGRIWSESAIPLGTHFSIDKFEASIDAEGNVASEFVVAVRRIQYVDEASIRCRIDAKGFHVLDAKLVLEIGAEGETRFWGKLTVAYSEAHGFSVTANVGLKIKEGLIAHGALTYNTESDKVTQAEIRTDPIPLLRYGPRNHVLFARTWQFPIFYLYVAGIYVDAGFSLEFAYSLDLMVRPRLRLVNLSLQTFKYDSATGSVDLLGELSAALVGTPRFGVGAFIFHPKVLRGGGGIEIPVAAKARLPLGIALNITYDGDGRVTAGASVGLCLKFGVEGEIKPWAEFVVLNGAYTYPWKGESLFKFTLLKERDLFTYVVDFNSDLSKAEPTKPKIPTESKAAHEPKATHTRQSKTEGETKLKEESKDKEPKGKGEIKDTTPGAAEQEGGFSLASMKAQFTELPLLKKVWELIQTAVDVWETVTGAVDKLISLIKKWVGDAIDAVITALKGIVANKGVFNYLKVLFKERMNPTLYNIIEPILSAFGDFEATIWDLLENPPSDWFEWSVTLFKAMFHLAFDGVVAIAKSIKRMIEALGRLGLAAVKAGEAYVDMWVQKGKVGVRRHPRYIGAEADVDIPLLGTYTVGKEVSWMAADEWKIELGGVSLGDRAGDIQWPTPSAAVGYGLWFVLHELSGVHSTNRDTDYQTGSVIENYWTPRDSDG